MTVPKKEQNAGVELLLKRMETHPEEFTGENAEGSKWSRLISNYEQHLTKEDRDALNAGMDKILQQRFTEKVLEGLVDPKPSTKLEELLSLKRQNATLSAGATLGAYSNTATATLSASGNLTTNSLTLGKTTLEEQQVKHMIAHLDWLKREEKLKSEQQRKATIFGRLHDYFGNL